MLVASDCWEPAAASAASWCICEADDWGLGAPWEPSSCTAGGRGLYAALAGALRVPLHKIVGVLHK